MSKKLALIMALIVVLIIVLVTAFKFQRVKADSTIYIRDDGSVDPLDAPISSIDNVTYTLTDNISDTIVVERSHVIIDGAGYVISGSGSWGAGIGIQNNVYNVTIKNVNIKGFGFGIGIMNSWNNTIFRNNITNNANGIFLSAVYNTTISGNNVTNNTAGIWLDNSASNKFYHNYFINNTNQVYIEPNDANDWDDGYSSGGNYWSNFKERYPGVEDVNNGPYQNETGSDGFWDEHYEIDINNIDHYPVVPEFPPMLIMPLFMVTTLLTAIVYVRKHFK